MLVQTDSKRWRYQRLGDIGEDEDSQATTEDNKKLDSSNSNVQLHQEPNASPERNSSKSVNSIEDPTTGEPDILGLCMKKLSNVELG